jgi:hypothetical protein
MPYEQMSPEMLERLRRAALADSLPPSPSAPRAYRTSWSLVAASVVCAIGSVAAVLLAALFIHEARGALRPVWTQQADPTIMADHAFAAIMAGVFSLSLAVTSVFAFVHRRRPA